ncbi:caspase family protein [Caballeronia sp. AZ10_KS36]|uniref:caspase family protein n=1 Tax=Caballeronia sp. AZ10_KS36 TaxID=2921757 RepID=UPI002028964C|nr:caspase family protein [Caballeronia sp. AZ10_KS36]
MHCVHGQGLAYFNNAREAQFVARNTPNGYAEEKLPGNYQISSKVFVSEDRQNLILTTPITGSEQPHRSVSVEIFDKSGRRIAKAADTLPIDSEPSMEHALALDTRSLVLYYLEPRTNSKPTLDALGEPRKIGAYDLRWMRKLSPEWMKDLEATEIRMVPDGMLLANNERTNHWALYNAQNGSVLLAGDGLVAGVDAADHRNRILVAPKDETPYLVAIPSLRKTQFKMFDQQPVSAMYAAGDHVWITTDRQLRYTNLLDFEAQTILDEPHEAVALDRGKGRILVFLSGEQRKAQLVVISPDRAKKYIDLPEHYVPTGSAIRVDSGWLVAAISETDNKRMWDAMNDDIDHIAYGQNSRSKLQKTISTAYCLVGDDGKVTVLKVSDGIPDQVVFAPRAHALIVLEGRLLRFMNWPSLDISGETTLDKDYDRLSVSPTGELLLLKGNYGLEALSIETRKVLSEYDAEFGEGDIVVKDESHAYVTRGRTLLEWNFGDADAVVESQNKVASTSPPFADSFVRKNGDDYFMESPGPMPYRVQLSGDCVRPKKWSNDFSKLLCQAEEAVTNRKSYAVFDRTDGREVSSFTNYGSDRTLPIFSPDGWNLLYVRQDKVPPAAGQLLSTLSYRLVSRDLSSGAETVLLEDARNLDFNFYSNSGNYLLGVELNSDEIVKRRMTFTYKVLDARTGGVVASFQRIGSDFPEAAVADDGDTVLIVDAGELSQYSAKDGERPRWTHSIPHLHGVALTKGDQKVLAFTSEGPSPRLFRADSGIEVQRFSVDAKDMSNPREKTDRILVVRDGGKAPDVRNPQSEHASSTVVLYTDEEPLRTARRLDDKNLLLLRADGQMTLYDEISGSARARIVVVEGGGWVLATADGLFDASNMDDVGVLHWVRPDSPGKTFPIETYLANLYEPQLMWKLLHGAAVPNPNLIGVETELPSVDSISIKPQSADTVNVEVRVNGHSTSSRSGDRVASVKLFRDGKLVGVFRVPDDPLRARGGIDAVFSHVRLPSGHAGEQTTFSAYAFNRGGFKGPTVDTHFTRTEEFVARKRRAYLVSIGVNQYANSRFDLNYAAGDAEAFFHEMSTILKADKSIDEVISFLMTSPAYPGEGTASATKENIRRTLMSVAGEIGATASPGPSPVGAVERAGPQDLVFVFFSGHGHLSRDGEFFVLPSDIDSRPADERTIAPRLLKSSISSAELAQWLEGLDAAEVTMILDACHSGGAIETNFRPGPLASRGLGQLAYDKGMRILAGSQADSVALEAGDLKHGYLTYALIVDGLDHGAADFRPPDGSIWLDEWLAYARKRVPELTKSTIQEAPGSSNNEPGRTHVIDLRSDIPSEKTTQRPVLFDFGRGASTLKIKESGSVLTSKPHQ